MREFWTRLFLTGVLCIAGSGVRAAPIYDLSFSDGGPDTLTGFIETDVTSGNVLPADILSWGFTALGTPAFTIGSASGGNFTCDGVGSVCFTANAGGLFFDFSGAAGLMQDNFRQEALPDVFQVFFTSPAPGALGVLWIDHLPLSQVEAGHVFAVPLQVGVVESVPEPASAWLLCAAIGSAVGVSGIRFPRRRFARS